MATIGEMSRKLGGVKRTVASTCCPGLSLKSILLFLVLIHFPDCGQTANFSSERQKEQQKSQLMDMMQATQPQQCHALRQNQNMDSEDKIVLSPIIFQGKRKSKCVILKPVKMYLVKIQSKCS